MKIENVFPLMWKEFLLMFLNGLIKAMLILFILPPQRGNVGQKRQLKKNNLSHTVLMHPVKQRKAVSFILVYDEMDSFIQ